MLFLLFFMMFSSAYAQDIIIFVDIEKDNKVQMTNLIASHARVYKNNINSRLASYEGVRFKKRNIRIYDQNNFKYLNNKCDYLKSALECGIKNKHWTITTSIFREEMQAVFMLNLHDETGNIISTSAIPVWGYIEFLPQWKLTQVKGSGMMGEQSQTILERWPDKRVRHPPYIRANDVTQGILSLFLSFDIK